MIKKMANSNISNGAASSASIITANGAIGAVRLFETCAHAMAPHTSKRGLTVHQRSAHPVEFHATHQVEPRERSRLPVEERNRMAHMEANLLT